MKNSFIISAFLSLAMLGAFGNGRQVVAAPEISLAERVMRQHILPSYEKLAAKSEAMHAQLKRFCRQPVAAQRIAVDGAFKGLVRAWAAIEHIRFGPVGVNNIHDRLYFWPDRKGIGRKQVEGAVRTGKVDILDPQLLKKKSAALQGLGALEHLLYGSAASEISAGSSRGKFRCQFAHAVALNISHLVRDEILAKWSGDGGYATHFLNPGDGNAIYRTDDEVKLEISKSYLNGLHYLRDNRLAGPLGMRRGARRKIRAAFAKSGLSMVAIRANILGLRDLFVAGGMADWIGGLERAVDGSVVAEFNLALKRADGISLPLSQAVEDEDQKSKLVAMGFPLKNARKLVQQVLMAHTDLPVGMNALDGD